MQLLLYLIIIIIILPSMTQNSNSDKERHIAKVSNSIHYGKDGQADDKYIILNPANWAETDPFLLMAEDWFSTNGFDWHPHRGIETITVVLEGELEHHDNRGGHGVLKPGDVQWMTAGQGILHSEMAHNKQQVHTLQLWLNLPAENKMVEPTYSRPSGRQGTCQTRTWCRSKSVLWALRKYRSNIKSVKICTSYYARCQVGW